VYRVRSRNRTVRLSSVIESGVVFRSSDAGMRVEKVAVEEVERFVSAASRWQSAHRRRASGASACATAPSAANATLDANGRRRGYHRGVPSLLRDGDQNDGVTRNRRYAAPEFHPKRYPSPAKTSCTRNGTPGKPIRNFSTRKGGVRQRVTKSPPPSGYASEERSFQLANRNGRVRAGYGFDGVTRTPSFHLHEKIRRYGSGVRTEGDGGSKSDSTAGRINRRDRSVPKSTRVRPRHRSFSPSRSSVAT
jgi:hypothetical protein